jgi:putative PIN family toxin of toxin-antitoxin system
VRAVLDPNVLVAALISPGGPPRAIVVAWTEDRFELIGSPALLGELRDVLSRPKFRRWVSSDTATAFIDGLQDDATTVDDPQPRPSISPDPDDDYLLALALAARADCLVSGDRHLTSLVDARPPVLTPRQFLEQLDDPGG